RAHARDGAEPADAGRGNLPRRDGGAAGGVRGQDPGAAEVQAEHRRHALLAQRVRLRDLQDRRAFLLLKRHEILRRRSVGGLTVAWATSSLTLRSCPKRPWRCWRRAPAAASATPRSEAAARPSASSRPASP